MTAPEKPVKQEEMAALDVDSGGGCRGHCGADSVAGGLLVSSTSVFAGLAQLGQRRAGALSLPVSCGGHTRERRRHRAG